MEENIHKIALDFFIKNQNELVEKYNGKELLLCGAKIAGVFDTVKEAYNEGVNKFGLGNFSLQTCKAGADAYTVTISTLGIIQ